MSMWGRAGKGPDNSGRKEGSLMVLRSQETLPSCAHKNSTAGADSMGVYGPCLEKHEVK